VSGWVKDSMLCHPLRELRVFAECDPRVIPMHRDSLIRSDYLPSLRDSLTQTSILTLGAVSVIHCERGPIPINRDWTRSAGAGGRRANS
jgi:hypothetical protein